MKPVSKTILLLLLTLIVLGGLLVYGVKGTYSRYAQDDYCYSYRVKEQGFFKTQLRSYLDPVEYNGNRYSLTLTNNLVEILGGVNLFPVIPALLILLWLIGIYWLTSQFMLVEGEKTGLFFLLLSSFFLFFVLYLSPKLYQVLFWLAAQQAYLMPLIVYTYILAMILHFSKSDNLKFHHFLIVGLFSLYAGGGAETTTIWFFAVIILVFVMALLKPDSLLGNKNAKKLLVLTIVMTGIALCLLAFSPSNAENNNVSRSPFMTVIKMSFIYGWDFILNSLKSTPLPYLVLIAFGFFAARLNDQVKSKRWIDYAGILILGFLALYLLSVATMFPTMYAMSVYPGSRALTPTHLGLLIYLVSFGWGIERILRILFAFISENNTVSTLLTVFVGILLMIYAGRAVYLETLDLPLYRARAEAWDIRDEMILDAIEAGEQDITVPAFDSIFEITELQSNPGNWVNICAAKYYGVNSITAVENYEGIGTFPIGK